MTKILIIRMSAIGDIVMSSPLAEGLKKKYPDASVSWLAQPGMDQLLKNSPYVDEVIVWPRGEWQQLWKQKKYWQLIKTIRAFSRELKQRKFTIAVDAQGLLKSGLMAWLSGAKQRIGLNSKEGSQLLMTQVYRAAYSPRMGGEYRFLLSQLDADAETPMHIFASETDKKTATKKVGTVMDSQNFVVLCPYSSRLNKNWFEKDWLALADNIFQQLNMKSVILGGPADKEQAQHIAQQSLYIENLAGETSLTEAAAIIESATALVGVDTGLTHMGVINHIPSVILFGSTRPYSQTDSPVATTLYHGPEVPTDISTPMFKVGGNYMDQISVSEVMSSLKALLAK
jgi:heptosyltransferase-1